MCGIAGILGPAASGERVRRMVDAMRHRGPDDSGVESGEGWAVGMSRLAIRDLSDAGHQPMSSDDGGVRLVFNGEIYNTSELSKTVRRASFRSSSDTEILLRSVVEPNESPAVLRGMFAYAAVRPVAGSGNALPRATLARDRLGIKPLLLACVDGNWVFASEMEALLASGLVEPRVDRDALRYLLTMGSLPQPRTLLEGVEMVPSATAVELAFVAGGGAGRWTRPARYDRVYAALDEGSEDLRRLPYERQVDRVAGVLRESVEQHLLSDTEVGAFLSGGVDSSLIVGLMTQMAGGDRVRTFSVGFEESGAATDETGEAEVTAKRLGTDHELVWVTGRDLADHLDHYVDSIDQPSVDGVNSYFVCKAAARHVKVALSGTGGDEGFAGYPWFAQMVQHAEAGRVASLTGRQRRLLALRRSRVGGLLPRRWKDRAAELSADPSFAAQFSGCYHAFHTYLAGRVLGDADPPGGEASLAMAAEMLAPYDEMPEASALDRTTALVVRTYATNQLMRDIDAVSMAHSLEVRTPLYDHRVIAAALALPESSRLRDPGAALDPASATYAALGSKRILIDAGVKLGALPAGIGDQKKRGFNLPMNLWLGRDLRDAMEDALSPTAVAARGLFDPAVVTEIKDDFLAGRAHWSRPWLLMLIELWCRRVLDGPGASERGSGAGVAAGSAER